MYEGLSWLSVLAPLAAAGDEVAVDAIATFRFL